jgi:hypothetical protein
MCFRLVHGNHFPLRTAYVGIIVLTALWLHLFMFYGVPSVCHGLDIIFFWWHVHVASLT